VRLRRRLAASPVGSIATLPLRVSFVGKRNWLVAKESAGWLARSREYTNFTYDLSEGNLEHLAWFVAEVAGVPVAHARRYIAEIDADDVLRRHIIDVTATSDHRWVSDPVARYGRRVGWYALVRAIKPNHVVETGTDKGLSACLLAAAVLRNERGRVTTIDINDDAGFLIRGAYAEVIDLRIGDSLEVLKGLDADDVGLFIHDSWHTREHELAEFDAITDHLVDGALMLSDNCHVTDALPSWAEDRGWRFLYFQEQPIRHWYPGGGIGVAWA
jgi:cephalosporin hydroxylase